MPSCVCRLGQIDYAAPDKSIVEIENPSVDVGKFFHAQSVQINAPFARVPVSMR